MKRPLWLAMALFTLTACKEERRQVESSTSVAAASRPASSMPAQTAGSMPAQAAGSMPAQAASSMPAAADAAPIRGTVTLDPSAASFALKPSDVLFVMARQSVNKNPGMLVATVRFQDLKFPVEYELSGKNVMMAGAAFQGPFLLTARLDRDGDPMTKDGGDLYASHPEELKGGESVALALKAAPAPTPGAAAPTQAPASAPAR